MGVTIRHNSFSFKKDPFYGFDAVNGYFGEKLPGNQHIVRTIFTNGDPAEEAKKMFDKLSKGAQITTLVEGHMWKTRLDDGTTLSLRIDYPPGHAPAVQISVSESKDPAGIKSQKVHFAKRKEK